MNRQTPESYDNRTSQHLAQLTVEASHPVRSPLYPFNKISTKLVDALYFLEHFQFNIFGEYMLLHTCIYFVQQYKINLEEREVVEKKSSIPLHVRKMQ